MLPVSREFIIEVRMSDQPAYKTAKKAGIHPCTLSQIISGYTEVQPGDHRVLAVAQVLGLDGAACFE